MVTEVIPGPVVHFVRRNYRMAGGVNGQHKPFTGHIPIFTLASDCFIANTGHGLFTPIKDIIKV